MTQGTIKHFDDATRTGALLLDDDTEVEIDAATLDQQIRTLRIGQRVKFELTADDGRQVARSLRIVTFD